MQRRAAFSSALRVLVLADGDEPPATLDEPAVACRIAWLEAERDQCGVLGEARAHGHQRLTPKERNVRVSDENVVISALDRSAGRQHRMRRPETLSLNEDLRSWSGAQDFSRDVIPIGTDDDRDIARSGPANGCEDMREDRPTGDFMQHFRPA